MARAHCSASASSCPAGRGPVSASLASALAGGVSWLDAFEEHRRLADRYASVATRLATVRQRADRVVDPDGVRRLALDADRELRTEGSGWIDVMRYREVELLV